MTVGNTLKSLRGSKTQGEVATALGISKSAWAMYERGDRVPRDEIKVRIARYFNKTVQGIFFADQNHST